jgi:aminoglycoside 3-N-acetyltransferase
MTDKANLIDAFGAAGIQRGDSLMVHSSFRKLRPVDGGPETVLDALLQAIGPDGNLMLPTFNYTSPLPDPYFDPAETPCRTGIIAELGRKRPAAVRSLHPTHSVAVIGPRAAELTDRHLATRAFGVGSPVDRLAQMGGKVLLIGVGHTSNSTIHVAEEHAGVPKPRRFDDNAAARVLMPDGRVISHPLDSSSSCSAGFGAAEYAMRCRHAIRDARIGGALVQLATGLDVIRCVGALLAQEPDILLCSNPACAPCTATREALRRRDTI